MSANIQIFDTHAHYDDERFDDDREQLFVELQQNGVKKILNAAASIESLNSVTQLAKQYDFIYASVGIHPEYDDIIDKIRECSKQNKVVAIGEIGLDYYYDDCSRDLQKYWFERQVQLARELGLPIIVHDREAHEDCINIIKKTNAKEVGGIFHCFSGSREMVVEVLKQNFYIAIGGVVTFKNARKTVEVVKDIPLDRLLIETDCPYLAPEPNRGKRNHSGNLIYVIRKIAEIKGLSEEQVAAETFRNAMKVFCIYE